MIGVMGAVFEVMARRWEWGVADCCTSASDVFARLHGVDPMAALRGRYSTAFGAARVIAAEGGFVRMCEAQASLAGLHDGNGAAGEIGVIRIDDKQLALAICTAPGIWQGKTLGGFAPSREMVRCWRA